VPLKKINIKKMIRPNCAGFEPYVAGRPVETIKRELGLKKVVKLASNENPLGPSKKAVEAIKRAASSVFYYPDSNSWKLKKALSVKYGIETSKIMLGAGSDELIELIAKLFFKPGDEIVVSDHAFIRYKMAGELMGSKVVSVPMKDFTHDLKAMAEAVNKKTKAVFIANPNNPTGTYNSTAEFESFMKKVSRFSPLVVMDEAYYEFASVNKDYPQTQKYLSRYPNLIILRTFSKVYALAGLRVGYGFAGGDIVDYIERIRPPFNISSVAQAAAEASLSDKTQVSRGIKLVEQGKKFICSELDKLGVPYINSAANFLLLDIAPLKGREAFQSLLKKGVIARAMDEYDMPDFIRVSVGLEPENRMFIKAFKALLGRKN